MTSSTRSLVPRIGITLLLAGALVFTAVPPAMAAPVTMVHTGAESGGGVTGYAPLDGDPIVLDPA